MTLATLSRTVVAAREMVAKADACWKPFAVQLYPELQFRADDTEWRSCLVRKVSEPGETPESIKGALMCHGENIWKYKTVWYRCECGSLYFIGECGRAMETARCVECGRDVGGWDHQLVETSKGLTDEEAGLVAAALRPSISNMQVTVRRLSGEIWTALHVPRDCTAREAKWRLTRQIDIPAQKQSLVIGDATLSDDCVLATCLGESTTLDIMLILSS